MVVEPPSVLGIGSGAATSIGLYDVVPSEATPTDLTEDVYEVCACACFFLFFFYLAELEFQEIPVPPPAQPKVSPGGSGLTAVALYDYQAADDDEISFNPDDVITHIEQVFPFDF